MIRLRIAAAALGACVALLPGVAAAQTAPAPVVPGVANPAWDQPANIRDAAERLGKLQRAQGAEAVMRFIDACYRTHGLASAYSAAFEACIAQDYMQTKLLTRIYSRLPPESLQKLRAPTPDALAQSMARRVVAAFSQYNIPAADAEAFKAKVDQHGVPVFLKTVFPNAKAGEEGAGPDTPQNTPPETGAKRPKQNEKN